jgi:hypothetical protein
MTLCPHQQPALSQKGSPKSLEARPEVAAGFDAMFGPVGHGTPNPQFAIGGGWDGVRRVVDVGGGSGAMRAEVLRTRGHALKRSSSCREPWRGARRGSKRWRQDGGSRYFVAECRLV